jgi:hypothetical protein
MLRKLIFVALVVAAFGLFNSAPAQTGYGVNSGGTLFSFDVNNAGTVNMVSTLPFVPEGIDFRPGTNTLYALDVGAATTQLYTINVVTGVATPVGDGFPSEVTGQLSGNYSLLGATIGFDFNPRTLQTDGSVRIRVVASNGTNLRLNSDTGEVAAVDTPLDYPDADPNAAATPMVDAAAYLNSARSTTAAGGTTTLYVMDFGTDDLATQNPPNAGQLNTVGPFGASVNAESGIGFDIVTEPAAVDDGIGGDRAYAVLKRPDAPTGNEGAYMLYDVNLSTGQITGGRLVGGGEANFAGGFAVLGDIVSSGGLIISEFRVRGPNPSATPQGSETNEFIELYNASGSDIIVSAADASEGFSVAASVGGGSTRLFVIPNGTLIRARGHYLAVNPLGFSLSGYPADTPSTGVSFGDNTYTQDIGDNKGIAVFNTANTANYTLANRLDAVGSTEEANALFKEGTGYPALGGAAYLNGMEYSFYRDNCGKGGSITTFGVCPSGGFPVDTNNNGSDFIFVDTSGTNAGAGQRLGAPGPESSQSPIQRNTEMPGTLLDPGVGTHDAPNRYRDTSDTQNAFGTMAIRRTIQNNTGESITRLRFRIVDQTTWLAPGGIADLRARSSIGPPVVIAITGSNPACTGVGNTCSVQRTTLEEPPTQSLGGAFNSTLTVTLDEPVLNGQYINVEFLLGVEKTGRFKFYVNVEALTEEPRRRAVTAESPPRKEARPSAIPSQSAPRTETALPLRHPSQKSWQSFPRSVWIVIDTKAEPKKRPASKKRRAQKQRQEEKEKETREAGNTPAEP